MGEIFRLSLVVSFTGSYATQRLYSEVLLPTALDILPRLESRESTFPSRIMDFSTRTVCSTLSADRQQSCVCTARHGICDGGRHTTLPYRYRAFRLRTHVHLRYCHVSGYRFARSRLAGLRIRIAPMKPVSRFSRFGSQSPSGYFPS